LASIDVHLPLIRELAKKSRIIVEIGIHRANTTRAILDTINDTSSKLISIDRNDPIDFTSNNSQWTFVKCDCRYYTISLPIHFLLIDCDPDKELLESILQDYGKRVKNYIFIHDTINLEDTILEWMEKNNFKILVQDRRESGMITLQK